MAPAGVWSAAATGGAARLRSGTTSPRMRGRDPVLHPQCAQKAVARTRMRAHMRHAVEPSKLADCFQREGFAHAHGHQVLHQASAISGEVGCGWDRAHAASQRFHSGHGSCWSPTDLRL